MKEQHKRVCEGRAKSLVSAERNHEYGNPVEVMSLTSKRVSKSKSKRVSCCIAKKELVRGDQQR